MRTDAAPPLGVVLGNIELREVRGSGRFATVYRAWDPRHRRQIAVKMPKGGASNGTSVDEEARSRFEREERVQAILDGHPSIVRIHRSAEDAGRPLLVLEYVDGPNLAELGRGRRPSAGEIAQVGVQIAEALAHAHARGIVHRDVTPTNILTDIARGRVKLGDFGGAQVSGEPQRSDLGVAGTPAYMSPEQEQGRAFLDARSDIYSLGCSLYEFATGVVYKIERRPIGALRPDLPSELAAAIERCVREVPDDRYPNAASLVEDLARLAPAALRYTGPATEPEPSSPPVSLPRTVGPGAFASRRVIVWIAIALVLALGAGIALAGALPGLPTAVSTPSPLPAPVATAEAAVLTTATPSSTPSPSAPTPTPTAQPAAPVRTAAPAPAAPVTTPVAQAPITVTPTSGRPGTAFRVRSAGLTPGASYVLTVHRPNLGPQDLSGTVPSDGVLVVTYATQLDYFAGTYQVFLATGGGVRSTSFEVR